MTEQEIQEGNKLILEFMEFPRALKQVINDTRVYYDVTELELPNGVSIAAQEHFIFHRSWDWLMPVVEKIESLDFASIFMSKTYHGEFSIEISWETPTYHLKQNNKYFIIKDKALSKKESIWTAIVEFIKWYNTKEK